MSVFNAEDYLALSIESVLVQTFSDFEFLIIDDGSSDQSVDIVNSFADDRIRLVKNEQNLGLVASLNRGVDLSLGDYIARLDADDIAETTRLEEQALLLDNQPDTVLVGSWLTLIDDHGLVQGEWRYPVSAAGIRWFMLFNSALAHPSAMYRRAIVQECGAYNADFKYGEDYELWSRLVTRGRAVNIPRCLVRYRIHPAGVSSARRQEQEAVQLRIAKINVENYLVVDAATERALRLVLGVDRPSSAADVIEVRKMLERLAAEFAFRESPDEAELELLQKDRHQRIRATIMKLSFAQRLECVLRYPGAVPLSDWLSGRVLSLLLDSGTRMRLRDLISPGS
jgi:glycosyltransferase involved in cell wall biosynthesis